jgi:DUF917 family protein
VPTTLQDVKTIEDFVTGLAFLGTGGGGGRLQDGIDLLAPLATAGRAITLVGPDELPEDAWTCAIASWGGRDPDTPPPAAELATYGLLTEKYSLVERMAEAARELAAFRGVTLGAVVSMELGSAATVGTILTGMALGVPTVDSDYVGRAIPEAGQSKMDIHGRPPTPMAFVDRWGNVTIVKSTVTAIMADRLGRMISVAAYGKGVGGAGWLSQVRDARRGFIRGSLLTALKVGAALRAGRETRQGLRPLTELTGGRVVFTGEAVATDWDTDEAYVFRKFTYRIAGRGAFAGEDCRIWVKNEHHVVWRADRVVATSPDIIAVLDAEASLPLSTRGDVTPGRRVVVYAMKALDPDWHTPKGLALLGPRHFGFDFDYVPFDAVPA